MYIWHLCDDYVHIISTVSYELNYILSEIVADVYWKIMKCQFEIKSMH